MSGNTFHRVIIKLGTSTLTCGTSFLSPPIMVDIVRQIAHLHSNNTDVLLVSSGAMAAGRQALNFPNLPKQIPVKQMLAAVGQPQLLNLYSQLFGLYGINVAQVLLTRSDIENRKSYLNARNTLYALLEQKVVPIINENDTVATEEIRLGDNDNLSGQVANLVDADMLIMLTDQPGIMTADPRISTDAIRIKKIDTQEIPDRVWRVAGGSENSLGTGGMITKLQAADLARRSGATVVVARGSDEDIILKILNGEDKGTWFLPVSSAQDSRKRYILTSGKFEIGNVIIDDGAVNALNSGSSLLPIGIIKVEGSFERGDAIKVRSKTGKEIARGLTNYAHDQLRLIAGHHSAEIEELLGFSYGEEVIHRNDLVLL